MHPGSYWSRFHLEHDGFQFDVTRTRNPYGCYAFGRPNSKIPIESALLRERYAAAVAEATRSEKVRDADRAVDWFYETHEDFIDELQDRMDREEPSHSERVEAYVFLSAFEWLRIERDLLHHMRTFTNTRACEEHYRNVVELLEANVMFITFRRLVLWAPLPAACT